VSPLSAEAPVGMACADTRAIPPSGVGREVQEMPFMHLSAHEIDVQFQYRFVWLAVASLTRAARR